MNLAQKALLSSAILSALFASASPLFAQQKAIEIANVYDIADKEAKNGDILVNLEGKGLHRAKEAYTNTLFGVLQDDPLIAYRNVDKTGKAVARTGIAEVNVTNANGPINKGDFITGSTIPGYGQKADQSGYVLGSALTEFRGNASSQIEVDGKKISTGKITVALRIEYAEITNTRTPIRLLNQINAALSQSIEDPEKFGQIIRYGIAIFIILVTIIFGFMTVTNTIGKGIEAIGRNPVVKFDVNYPIRVNIIYTIIAVIIGIGAAILIILL